MDARKGVEAAEALRIRQATQSASVYSVYLAAMNAIKQGLKLMCRWAGYNADAVILDAPTSLTHGIPDSSVIKQIVEGFGEGVIPLPVIHRYLISSGLLEQTVGYEDYIKMLAEQQRLKEELLTKKVQNVHDGEEDGEEGVVKKKGAPRISKEVSEEAAGIEDKIN